MRPVLHGDAVSAARALLAVPEPARRAMMERLIRAAFAADEYRRETGKCHPMWGDGTLEVAARNARLAPEPYLDDPDYCACLILVFEALLACRITRACS